MLAQIKRTLEGGDPIIRKWFLVDGYFTPFVMSALYVIFVKKWGPEFMKNRKPYNLRNVMIVFNFFLVITYLACVSLLAYFFFTTEAITTLCEPTRVKFNHWTYWAASAGWIIYLLKYIELTDTLFFILRKKYHLITNLHVIHHASLPILGWLFFRTETSGFQFLPGVLNAIIHIIMYTYYGLAAFGPKFQKYLWWKEFLTKLQMGQFIIMLLFVLIIIPLTGCKTSQHVIYLDIFFALLFFGFFYNYYIQNYKKKPCQMNGKIETNGNCTQIHENGTAKGEISAVRERRKED